MLEFITATVITFYQKIGKKSLNFEIVFTLSGTCPLSGLGRCLQLQLAVVIKIKSSFSCIEKLLFDG